MRDFTSRIPNDSNTQMSPSCSSRIAAASAPVPFMTRSSAYSESECKSSWLEKIAVNVLISSSMRSDPANDEISSLNAVALCPNSSSVSIGMLQCSGLQSPIRPFSEIVIIESFTSRILPVSMVSLLLTVIREIKILTNPTSTPAIMQEARKRPLNAIEFGTPRKIMKNGNTIPMKSPNPIIRIAKARNVFRNRFILHSIRL
ncbi:hypothetical protein SDC9_140643 [bioreactor metagenome]|uniref:Uncharacterized protein n=1 Tax=bioreactor metagenome TaxID=1076179 RepID=A0A645DW22_9ZZZZ